MEDSVIVVLFQASSSVIAILFSIWGLIQVVREQRVYLPRRSERFATISFFLLVSVCIISLWLFVLQGTDWAVPSDVASIFVFLLSTIFSLAIILISVSFAELIKRV